MKPGFKVLTVVGSASVLVGSIDPMEGSVLILIGSGLVALGMHLGHADSKAAKDWIMIFILNVVGVGQLWELSAFGGFGGTSGHSLWWGLLILPYAFGWLLGLIRIVTTVSGMVKTKLQARRSTPTDAVTS